MNDHTRRAVIATMQAALEFLLAEGAAEPAKATPVAPPAEDEITRQRRLKAARQRRWRAKKATGGAK